MEFPCGNFRERGPWGTLGAWRDPTLGGWPGVSEDCFWEWSKSKNEGLGSVGIKVFLHAKTVNGVRPFTATVGVAHEV